MSQSSVDLIVLSTFGLEAVVGRELKALGYSDFQTQDGRITFTADLDAICKTNLWLRSADRVLIKMGQFKAFDFGELFDRTTDLPWEKWLPANAEFPVRGKSIKSELHSVPTCQSIVKKAIVKRLQQAYRKDWFPEDGPTYAIEVAIRNDEVILSLDTSGAGLHKRGYRKSMGPSPLKETLAAGLVQLSYWNAERLLVDPFCGTGTILIEAAWIGRNIAPGLGRSFAAERWPIIDRKKWTDARSAAVNAQRHDIAMPRMQGYDNDRRALGMSRLHAQEANVADDIHFQQQEFEDFTNSRKYGCLITNPPYGVRSGEVEEAEEIYRQMGRIFSELDTWSKYVITPHSDFEQLVGSSAGRRRKLYNGNIACTYHQFPGPRPPRTESSETE
ncbi:Ribosomal RNA large subunit methyltransferase L [Polystyrenella longa]|uniref:Ribosomal RNA large subunit methyltransferase L n=1 Tax=Polystyrenella longa TaxID=2528007 RepID=A0A518CNR7_9PLAN|nr:class I SAM-dependent RNA methyltransferase [Polystyrenella longa]QDU80867.1 Ribosomal RNA large subunit methyltransferase L [Polystyrenella longa]